MNTFLLVNILVVGINVVILGLTMKLYTEVYKLLLLKKRDDVLIKREAERAKDDRGSG